VDIARPKKTWTTKRLLTIGGILILALLISGSIWFTSGKSALTVDIERLTISDVKKGIFQETIPVNGVVTPLTTQYLDATEAGRVEERYVEDGAIMKKGQPILRLSNTNLELTLASQETNVFAQLSQMQLARINAQQNTVSKLTQMADVESSFKEAERVYNLDKRLYDQKVIGSQEFRQAENNYNYYLQKTNLQREILKQDTVSTHQQSEQDKEAYAHAQSGLEIMRHKVGDLVLRSPIDGQLTSLDAEVGESKKEGDRLGQIDMLDGFKVRVDIDQHYISRIFLGLTGDCSFADTTYKLKIIKVFTQVGTTGTFQVDMKFVGQEPKGIRRGQTLQITLALSDAKTAVMIPKGGFYNQTGGNSIFKVSADGRTASKTNITIGQQSTDYYEVLSGLEPGDKVVTSSYENYGNMEILVFKKE
jgi:HlyD family secretion protein